MTLEIVSSNKSFGGWHALPPSLQRPELRHGICRVPPPQAEQGENLPVLYWLSGLTCTDENFMQKAGRYAWRPSSV